MSGPSPAAPLKGPLLARAWLRFINNPASLRYAMAAIIAATILTVVVGGLVIRLADPKTFSSIGQGTWWAIQTVTTVGYGDLVPESTLGRAVAAVVMLESVAFLAIVTASITSIFIEDRQAARRASAAAEEAAHRARLEASLEEVRVLLERLEQAAAVGARRNELPPSDTPPATDAR